MHPDSVVNHLERSNGNDIKFDVKEIKLKVTP